MNYLKKLILILSGLAIIVPALFFVDARYARSDDVQQVSIRLDLKILTDRYYTTQRDIWELEDRYAGKWEQAPREAIEKYRKLKANFKLIEADLEAAKQELRELKKKERD